jgi:hypothetical protein
MVTCPFGRVSLQTCTAHFADMATSGDNYLNCTKTKVHMKELLDIIIKFFELQEIEQE